MNTFMYEGKSLKNRNHIIFFTRVHVVIFCVLFSDIDPCLATHLAHLSTSLRMPLTNFAPPLLPRCDLQNPTRGFITDVLSSLLKSFHPLIHSPLTQSTVSILNLHSSVDFRSFHTIRCSSTVQVDSGAATFYELLRRLIQLDRHDPYMAYC
jgi:hypothetical protein